MPALPTGTVTFLFTDIEGSTRLLGQHPQAYPAALTRHDALLREAVERYGGCVFETVGDAFYAAFARPSDALAAALLAQQALHSEDWGEVGQIKARMGLHTGEVELRGEHYFGAPLYRCARLMAIGHGGQTLLSGATADLVRDALPPHAALREMGLHPLKDLAQSEWVHQLIHPELPDEFPPLRSLDTRASNLPAQLTSFVGREVELAAVQRQLADARLLTLTGPGGSGKTRLALEGARAVAGAFANGVTFVDLAPISDSALVVSALAQALGVREAGGQPLLASLQATLRDQHRLLVLDNFEQVLPAAPMVAELLRGGPRLRALVTSRAPLHLSGEQEYPVPPLELPKLQTLPSLAQLAQVPAVALFVQRAQAVQPAFRLTEGNAPAVAELCVRLDGLPLALELAAARIKLLPPASILARLQHRFALLTGGPRDQRARHRTLRAAIGWSHDLLEPREQVLFRQLGVFAGGCTLEAAEAVCDIKKDLGMEMLDGLGALVDQSLVYQHEGSVAEPRFGMLETIREYATEQLETSGEAAEVRRRHAAHYLAFAEAVEPRLVGPHQGELLDQLGAEHHNLRAALEWWVAGARTGDAEAAEQGLRLASALWRFWWMRGFISEGRRWLTDCLALPGTSERSAVRAKGLLGAGRLAAEQGEHAFARVLLEEESLAICQQVGHRQGTAEALNALGVVAIYQGEHVTARVRLEESLATYRALGLQWGVVTALNNLAMLAGQEGDLAAARRISEESLAMCREAGLGWNSVASLSHLGHVAIQERDAVQASARFAEGLVFCRAHGDKRAIAYYLEGLGEAAALKGQAVRATRLFATAAALRSDIGSPLPPIGMARANYERATAHVRNVLSEQAFAAAWNEGQATALEDVLDYALATDAPPSDLNAGLGCPDE